MKLGSWNARSVYRAGSLKAAARELGRYKLDVVGVKEVRWDKGVTVREGDYDFLYGKGNDKAFFYTVVSRPCRRGPGSRLHFHPFPFPCKAIGC